MEKCSHKFKYIENSGVTDGNKTYHIEKYQCLKLKCSKWYFKDIKTGKRVTFNGGIGEEIESNFK